MRRVWLIAGLAIPGLLILAVTARPGPGRPAGFLVLGIAEDRRSLDPAYASDIDWTPTAQICETLVVSNPGGPLRPGLAVSWARIGDRKWRFELLHGVRFQDGASFDAAAARLSLLRAMRIQANALLFRFRSIDTPDDHTLEITTEQPFAPLPEYLSYINFAIVSPGSIAKGDDAVALHPVGTGPFWLQSYIPSQSAVLARNEQYWGGAPRAAGVLYRVIPDPLTRLLALESGQIDAMRSVPLPEIPRLRGTSHIRVLTGPGRHVHHLTFNRAGSPLRRYFDDVRVRRAFNYAVDREALIEAVLNGAGAAANGPVPSWMEEAAALPDIPHNPELARRLLAEAGWPRGTRVRYVFSPGWLPQNEALAELLEAQFQSAGINLALVPMEFGGAAAAEQAGSADLRHRGITLTIGGAFSALWTRYDSINSALTSVHYANREVDGLFTQAENASDAKTLFEPIRRIQEIVSRDAADVPLFYEYDVVALSTSLKGSIEREQVSLARPEIRDVYFEEPVRRGRE
jgi:peptide/nickel transport system substrate-binding protein